MKIIQLPVIENVLDIITNSSSEMFVIPEVNGKSPFNLIKDMLYENFSEDEVEGIFNSFLKEIKICYNTNTTIYLCKVLLIYNLYDILNKKEYIIHTPDNFIEKMSEKDRHYFQNLFRFIYGDEYKPLIKRVYITEERYYFDLDDSLSLIAEEKYEDFNVEYVLTEVGVDVIKKLKEKLKNCIVIDFNNSETYNKIYRSVDEFRELCDSGQIFFTYQH